MHDADVTVLVPSEQGLQALAREGISGVLYDNEGRATPDQQQATVLMHGLSSLEPTLSFAQQLPRLRLVQVLNAGFDAWVGRLPEGVSLSNARGAHGATVAEWVVAVLLAHYRRLEYFVEAQSEHRWDRQESRSLAGSRVAVLGAGDIGQSVKRLLDPFGCLVSLVGSSARAGVLSLDDLRAQLDSQDVVVVALPLSPETAGVIDSGFLSGMKDGAILINAARGGLVDTSDLIAETESGRLWAILDVVEPEPLPEDHPLWDVDHVTITPHVAGITAGVVERAWAVAAAQVAMFVRGQTPDNVVLGPLTRERPASGSEATS